MEAANGNPVCSDWNGADTRRRTPRSPLQAALPY
jgi:hypothetical protein